MKDTAIIQNININNFKGCFERDLKKNYGNNRKKKATVGVDKG